MGTKNTHKTDVGTAAPREERIAEALRANLRRRKAQTKARKSSEQRNAESATRKL